MDRRRREMTLRHPAPLALIIMGVSGSGKSTLGARLAQALALPFLEGDAFHDAAAVAKMRGGQALTDDDRWPWLASIRQAIEASQARGENRVFACSALKKAYRRVLSQDGDVVFIHLKGDRSLIAGRLAARTGHYMNPDLLQSQFDTLEAPDDAITVDIDRPPEAIVEDICATLAGPVFAGR